MQVNPYPTHSGHQQKYRQGMISGRFPDGTLDIPWWFPAFCGTTFVQVLRGQNRNHHSGPVRNGVSKKRAPVRLRIRQRIEHSPERENSNRRDAERVPCKKAAFLPRHWHSDFHLAILWLHRNTSLTRKHTSSPVSAGIRGQWIVS